MDRQVKIRRKNLPGRGNSKVQKGIRGRVWEAGVGGGGWALPRSKLHGSVSAMLRPHWDAVGVLNNY